MVKTNPQVLEGPGYLSMVTIDNNLRLYAFLSSTEHDGHTMLVGPANVDNIATFEPEIPDKNVRRQIDTCNVPNVNRPIGVG
jgi:hypothetical protein